MLNSNLMAEDSPLSKSQVIKTGYDFQAGLERNAIGNYNIGQFTFSKGYGGTLTLGGTANGNGLMLVNDSLGSRAVQIDSTGARVFGTSNFILSYMNGTTPNDIAFLGADSTGTVYFQTGLGIPVVFGMNASTKFQMGAFSTGTLVVNGILDVNYGTALSQGTVIANLQGTADYATYATSSGTADYATNSGSSNYSGTAAFATSTSGGGTAAYANEAGQAVVAEALIDFNDSGNIVVAYRDGTDIKFQATGGGGVNKTAIVPTSQGYNALYTNESPDVWFMDICESKDKIDPLFLETIEEVDHFVKAEDINGNIKYQVWGIRKGMKDKRFESKTKEEFDRNNAFWSLPKTSVGGGVRHDELFRNKLNSIKLNINLRK